MGREALVHGQVGTEAGEVKALLESDELILRGDVRRRFAKALISDVLVEGPVLHFSCQGERVSLTLGSEAARSWSRAILAPPVTLQTKLGLDKGAKALLIGPSDDALLVQALAGALVDAVAQADMVIARIDTAEDLAQAQAACGGLPLWTVYHKGKTTFLGEGAIRQALRQAGWRDTKSCAVSERLTATRYNRAP